MENKKEVYESVEGVSLLQKYENGQIDDKSFLVSFSKVKVFFSTPFGDHKDGGSRLFVLSDQNEAVFLPVFTSPERATEFYEKAGRCGFLLMEDAFISFLETTNKNNKGKTPVKYGITIDPGYFKITIGANMLDTVINMVK
jgi:hypothetical protein